MATQNQQQPPPGPEAAMQPKPDHGETSYRGSGKLTGKAALITGADSGIGRAVAIAFAREGEFEAVSLMPDEERRISKALLDGMIMKYQTRKMLSSLSS